MSPERGTIDVVLRVAFWIVAVVAGLVGVAMLAAPGSTGDFFSWPLGPPPLAATVGGLYVASTLVFGVAARRSWGEVRGLVAAVLGLTIPTLAATLVHAEVFDFSRAVAVVWVVLFVASPLTYGTILVLRRRVAVEPGPLLPAGLRAAFGAVAVALVAFALLCWLDRATAASLVPFALAPMGAAFLGAWALFLAVLAAWPALRGGWRESWLPLLGLVAYPAGALLTALLRADELAPTGRAAGYAVMMCAVAVLAGYGLRSGASWRASTSPVTATPTPTPSRPPSATRS